ncbi:lipoprotein [Listeria fleischmannii 1991]|uniref:Uncharacterized protein conserved in bacteria n=2 Tax=Listeria fleischmannii TaxID=1069827 RepID=A0A2X3HGT0_9LIST|nr:DUF1307 domain-containing protein [Listeria fleischmannii]EMG29415.1 lipoprotein [Listeria fleischmannii subsp. fleischmannii LU2006-1]KMT58663.1 lipoprotein [Listeria fleischmannii 1991]SQC71837.1 Uncharacterized protein conserved in bacteria [Listeria fleischmannii subsp. fleischmannii]
MKKILSFVIVVIAVLGVLTACGNNEKKANIEKDVYVLNLNGADLEATFHHDGDKLKKVGQKMTYPLSYFGVKEGEKLDDATKKNYEKQAKEQYKAYENGKGTSLKSEFTDEALTIEMFVDLEKADEAQISSLLQGTSDAKNVSYKETVSAFEAQGFKKKES